MWVLLGLRLRVGETSIGRKKCPDKKRGKGSNSEDGYRERESAEKLLKSFEENSCNSQGEKDEREGKTKGKEEPNLCLLLSFPRSTRDEHGMVV